jgi:hypothetical protein
MNKERRFVGVGIRDRLQSAKRLNSSGSRSPEVSSPLKPKLASNFTTSENQEIKFNCPAQVSSDENSLNGLECEDDDIEMINVQRYVPVVAP